MRKASTVISIAIIAAALLAVLGISQSEPQAYAWIRIGTGEKVVWHLDATRPNQANGRIKYKIGSGGTADRANFAATVGDEFGAIQRSFAAWRNVYGSRVDFEFDGNVTTPSQNLNDDVNTIYWTNTELSPGVYAVTNTAFNNTTGQLLDADLVFNDRDFSWDVAGTSLTVGIPGRAYIEQIGIHEIGHFLGIDHTFLGHATLFPFTESGAINFLTLEADDTAPLVAEYPDPTALAPRTGTVSGRVTTGDGTGRLGLQVVLVDVGTRKAVVSALTDRAQGAALAGVFQIDQVPTGTYWVFVTRIFTAEMGAYYSQGFTDIMPCIWGVGVGLAGSPSLLRVTPGATIPNIDITVGNLANAHEPNNTTATATPLAVGQVVGSRIEASGDLDFFAVPLVQGEATVFHVHSDAMGQDLNPELELRGPDGTTVLVTGTFGAPTFNQRARDIESSFFGTTGVDYDCFIEHTAATSGTYFVRVRGTSNTTGGYALSVTSTATYTTVDEGTTRVAPSVPGLVVGGANAQIVIEPRNARGLALPTSVSRTVELLDADNGYAVLDSVTGAGPWSFGITPSASASTRRYAANVDGFRMLREAVVPTAGAIDPAQSSVRVVSGSLVADDADTSVVEVVLRDAGGRIRVDSTAAVNLTATSGVLTSGTANGPTVAATMDATTGVWRASLKAPATGTSLTVSATAGSGAGSVAVGNHVVALTAKATGLGGGPVGGGSGGGGCSLAIVGGNASGFNAAWRGLMFLMLLVVAAGCSRYRRRVQASRV